MNKPSIGRVQRLRARISGACTVLVMLGIAAHAGIAGAQAWKPEKNIEIVINTAPGSGQDVTGRFIQKILQERKLVESPVVVVNKPGGGGAIAYGYMNQHQRDGHFVAIASKSLLTNHIMGRSQITYTHLTPLAILFEEYISVAVKSDSPIKSGRDFIERMKKDPAAFSFGVATSLGNPNHQGVAMALKDAGVDLRKTRTAVFQSGGNAVTALLGGHVDVVPGSVGLMRKHMEAGNVRLIAIAAPQRLGGAFAQTPTWREQGVNAVVSNWRGLIGAGEMSPAQIAYWDNAMRGLARTEEWKRELERNNWADEFKGSAETRKYMDADYAELRAFLTELELTKGK
jgi:putative tricarboxylic transport membrane protein